VGRCSCAEHEREHALQPPVVKGRTPKERTKEERAVKAPEKEDDVHDAVDSSHLSRPPKKRRARHPVGGRPTTLGRQRTP